MNGTPSIDPRIKYVGGSKLRQMNATRLRELGDTIYVIQDNGKPLAVIVSYALFLRMQGRR